jgi:hypothetical protein
MENKKRIFWAKLTLFLVKIEEIKVSFKFLGDISIHLGFCISF